MATRWSYAAQGALGWGTQGAAAGSTIGSFFPGAGNIIGAGVGGGIGLVGGFIGGLLGADEEIERDNFAETLARGEVDPTYRGYLEEALADRYGELREDMGHQLARRGLADSSFAGRAMGELYSDEQNALASALAGHSMQRIALGNDLLARRSAERGALGANIATTLGEILNYNLAQKGLEMEQNRGRTQYAYPIGPGAAPAPTRPQPMGSKGWQPKTTRLGGGKATGMKKPVSPLLRNNPNAGRSGFGQMRRKTQAQPVTLGM